MSPAPIRRIPAPPESKGIEELYRKVQDLREHVMQEGERLYCEWRPGIPRRAARMALRNLAHYLALRQRDLRPIQKELTALGLSSLGRIESRVLPNLNAVISTLGALAGAPMEDLPPRPNPRGFFRGKRLLDLETARVFGRAQHRRHVRLMVTLSSDIAANYATVRDLILSGMDVARINCAHETPEAWNAIIGNIRRAEKETGRQCKVEMDLSGPRCRVAMLVYLGVPVRLHLGDRIFLTHDPTARIPQGVIAVFESMPTGIASYLHLGRHIWINEGKLGAIVEKLVPGGALLKVVHARAKGEALASEHGLNFPEDHLHISPLTDKDLIDLNFVAAHADLIGFSFVQNADDIDLLQRELIKRGREPASLPLVIKIETAHAVENLPELIVHASSKQPCAVMIARGDLAVEVGWDRLADVQEKILWICEAAHVPVIWATEVLERLVKRGSRSRAEITDAATAVRSECIMLNKGTYLREGLALLNQVLLKMQVHQSKKTAYLAPLSWK